jgi:hypothetical protein
MPAQHQSRLADLTSDPDGRLNRLPATCRTCCVEACLINCYLGDSDIYVHESCCLGVQRHLPTCMKRRKRQDSPETYMQQIWYLISLTEPVKKESGSCAEAKTEESAILILARNGHHQNLSKRRDTELLDILSRRWDVHILIPFRR